MINWITEKIVKLIERCNNTTPSKGVDCAVEAFLDDYERTQGHRPVMVDNRLPREEQYKEVIKQLEENGDKWGAEHYRGLLKDMKAGKPSPWSDGKW